MKLEIKYNKDSEGKIWAKITVLDKEDFPTKEILKYDYGFTDERTVSEDKVSALINEVREKLNAWRSITVPPDREVIL